MAYPVVEFTELSIVKKRTTKYDITIAEVEEYKNLKSVDEMKAFNELLIENLNRYERLEQREFIYHHLDCVADVKAWIFSLDKLKATRTEKDDLGIILWEKAFCHLDETLEKILDKIYIKQKGPFNKILTSLTVGELGYLLRILKRVKVFLPNSLSQLYNMFISHIITEKKIKNGEMGAISLNAMRNLAGEPTLDIINKIIEVSNEINREAKKDKKNLGA